MIIEKHLKKMGIDFDVPEENVMKAYKKFIREMPWEKQRIVRTLKESTISDVIILGVILEKRYL